MKKKSFFKFISSILLSSMLLILMDIGEVKAVLQSNEKEGATYNVSDWMIKIRKMEELGGVMGLSEDINEEGLNSKSGSNNIDVHMEKNTEYGALAILSASSYGNPNKIEDGDTTTGNGTGAVMHINNEWVAAGTINNAPYYASAKDRYKNVHTTEYVQQGGDAITETQGWHGSGYSMWFSAYGPGGNGLRTNPVNDNGFIRSLSGSIFSYSGHYARFSSYSEGPGIIRGTAIWTAGFHSRAVVVSGEGI